MGAWVPVIFIWRVCGFVVGLMAANQRIGGLDSQEGLPKWLGRQIGKSRFKCAFANRRFVEACTPFKCCVQVTSRVA